MSKKSAGILLYRYQANLTEVLLVHLGGPFWAKKDAGSWSIPKGEFEEDENPLKAAIRETEEETGLIVKGDFMKLCPVKLKSGKIIYSWSVQGNFNPSELKSNTFEIEWPPKSGQRKTFPEINKAAWYTMAEAREKITPAQLPLIIELETRLSSFK